MVSPKWCGLLALCTFALGHDSMFRERQTYKPHFSILEDICHAKCGALGKMPPVPTEMMGVSTPCSTHGAFNC